MKHIDEEIIELKNKMKKPEIITHTIKNIDYKFVEKSILDNKVIILLPQDFKEMSHEDAAIKYPYENRPKLIYTNESTSINISFKQTDTSISDSEIETFKNEMMKVMKKMQPTAVWLEDGMKRINERNVGYYELITASIDVNIYNLMFFTEMDDTALLCSFNCTEREMKDWRPIAKEIMHSIIVCG